MTLREFIEKVNFHEHYRVFIPNRDCLLFVSYATIHSPYDFEKDSLELNNDYWDNNFYCDDVYTRKEPDKQTKDFLDKYGDCKIFSMEIGSFKPCNCKKEDGILHMEYVRDESRPNAEYLKCFDLFVCFSPEDEDYKSKYEKLYNAVKWRNNSYKKEVATNKDGDGDELTYTNRMITLNLYNVTTAILASVEEEDSNGTN